jgi:hypothetical protein
MRTIKLGFALGLVLAVGVAATAHAVTVNTVTSTGSAAAGSKKAPVPFVGTWNNLADAGAGLRPAIVFSQEYWWEGVRFDGRAVPTCTAAQIDAAQSDAVCPKKSLVAVAPFIRAQIGPEGSPAGPNAACDGKQINMYNGGPGHVVWFVYGPGSQCAGVGYLPPVDVATFNVGKETHVKVTLPENINHPLPGVEGVVSEQNWRFLKVSAKAKGKKAASSAAGAGGKRFYATSVGCKGTRDFTVVTTDPEGTKTNKVSAGKCKGGGKKK